MTNQKRLCPICHTEVSRTRAGNIHGHFNTIGQPCRGDELPYRTTIPKTQTRAQLHREIRAQRKHRG